jgi:DNA-binding PadR family transcriptional regulator
MPISSKKWYPRKKPTLQIEILRSIATEGRLSKRMAEKITGSDYSDVSKGIDKLRAYRLVKTYQYFIPNRRDKRYYQLTAQGFYTFIDLRPSPKEFCKALAWFCVLKPQIDSTEFEKYWKYFELSYLENISLNIGFSQLSFFDKLFDRFLDDNGLTGRDASLPLCQKILECLAINRAITIEELLQEITRIEKQFRKEHAVIIDWEEEEDNKHITSREKLKDVINDYSLTSQFLNKYRKPELIFDPDEKIESYLDFLNHCIVISVEENNQIGNKNKRTTYELSLFGVMLVLALLRYLYIEGDEFQALLYYNLSLKDYYTKISRNYRDKLPLIFADRHILENGFFPDIVTFKNTRSIFTNLPFYKGGNKEIYDGIQAAATRTNHKLNELYLQGLSTLTELDNTVENHNKGNYYPLISRKLKEIGTTLKYSDVRIFISNMSKNVSPEFRLKNSHLEDDIPKQELELIEKIFADELTLLWCISQPIVFDVGNIYPGMFLSSDKVRETPVSQNDLLLRVLEKHRDIKVWFTDKIRGSWKYQKQALDNTSYQYQVLTGEKLS